MKPPRWAIFVSGRGSNLAAFLDEESAQVALVVSSKKSAWAVKRARLRGIPVHIHRAQDSWPDLLKVLERFGVTAIFLLGFMRIVPLEFLDGFKGPVINLHPSLLPRHPGLGSIEAAYRAGEDIGVTVHRVNEQVDAGEILRQESAVSGSELGRLTLNEAEYLVHRKEHELVRRVAADGKIN